MKRLIIVLFAAVCMALCDTPEKVILDTDSGPFNDDGVALVMLLQSASKVAVQGITVVPGNVWPDQGAEYMLAHIKMMHRPDVAVFIGAEAPLVHTAAIAAAEAEKFAKPSYFGAFATKPPRSRKDLKKPFYGFSGLAPQKQNAVDFMIETIEHNPGNVTILAIGPMTNLAMALRIRPDLATKIKRVVLWGGPPGGGGTPPRPAVFFFGFAPEAPEVGRVSKPGEKPFFG